ncbi:MAG: hypothetical protein ACFCU8_11025 [Thermosynechococcaceae cyanobacterium]
MKIQPDLLRMSAISTAAVLLGLSIAHTMPRGPTTASQAVNEN